MIKLKRENGFGWMALLLSIKTGGPISPIIMEIRIAVFEKQTKNGMITNAASTSLIFASPHLLKHKAETLESKTSNLMCQGRKGLVWLGDSFFQSVSSKVDHHHHHQLPTSDT